VLGAGWVVFQVVERVGCTLEENFVPVEIIECLGQLLRLCEQPGLPTPELLTIGSVGHQ